MLVSLLLVAASAGCGGQGPQPVRLVLLSPHRDEIKEEIAGAFPDWFRQRALERLTGAGAALDAWLANPRPEQQAPVEAACERFWHDWNRDDLPALDSAYRDWHEQPTVERGRALREAIAHTLDQLPPVELVYHDVGAGTSQIVRYINARFDTAGPNEHQGIGVDILFGGGTESFVNLANSGRLEALTLQDDVLRPIPHDLHGVPLYDEKGRWFGPVLSSFGILYNKDVLKRIGQPEPRRWEDLGEPGMRGWVSAGDPRLSGSVHTVYEIILQGHGWEDGFRLLLRLGADTQSFIRDSGTLSRMVSMGEVAAAGTVDVNALGAVGRDPDGMGFFLPRAEIEKGKDGKPVRRGGTVINPDAIAVLKDAPHLPLARAFVEFTLSKDGQKLFMLRPGEPGGPRRYPLCRLSVLPQLYDEYGPEQRSVGDANPFRNFDAVEYNDKVSGARWNALNDLFGAVVVDPHQELAAAWRAVLDGRRGADERLRLEEELFRPFCTADELLAYARRSAQEGPRLRVETVNRWGEEARQRYRAVRRAAEKAE